MDTFTKKVEYHILAPNRVILTNTRTGRLYAYMDAVESKLGSGVYGNIYQTSEGYAAKVQKNMEDPAELFIHKELSVRHPEVCPKVYDMGRIEDTNTYVIIMERYDQTLYELYVMTRSTDLLLDSLKQLARILKKLEPYQFNHRDLHPQNVMVNYDTKAQKMKVVLVDFGFSCATFDGTNYKGMSFSKYLKCFHKSRDLAQYLYFLLKFNVVKGMPLDVRNFIKQLLTFNLRGKICEMYKGCPPAKIDTWYDSYVFLNNSAVENPNTTPDGLLQAIDAFEKRQPIPLALCPPDYIENPLTRKCVRQDGVVGRSVSKLSRSKTKKRRFISRVKSLLKKI